MAKASLYRLNRWASVGGKDEINSIFIGQDARILAATNYGLSISTDNGVSWITHRTEDNAARNNIFRVSVNNLGAFTIHEIVIERIDFIVPFEAPAVTGNTVYSLRSDEYIQSRVPGDTGNGAAILSGTPYLVDSGSPIFTIVAHPSGDSSRALRVSNRSADWHTLDIVVENMGLNLGANTYTIRASGRIENPPEGATADLMGTASPWGRFGTVDVSGDGSFAVSGVISAASMAEHGSTDRVRVAASEEAGTSVFYVYELEITRN
jgi:hypothetical protein